MQEFETSTVDGALLTAKLEALGANRLTRPIHGSLDLSGAVIWDDGALIRAVAGSIVIAPGMRAAAEMSELVKDLSASGVRVVVLRSPVDVPHDVLDAAEAAHLTIFVVDGAVDWLQFIVIVGELLRSSASEDVVGGPHTGDLFELADAIASTVGGATVIEDIHRQIVAYSTLPGQPIDEDRREGILGRQVPQVEENEAQYAQVFVDPRPHRFPGREGKLDRVAVAIMAGVQPLGSIWVVDAGRDISAESLAALDRTAKIAALRLLERRCSVDLSRFRASMLVQRVLEGADDARLILMNLGFTEGSELAVVAFRFTDAENCTAPRMARLSDVLVSHAHSRERPAAVAVVRDVVYMLVETDGDYPTLESSVRRLVDQIGSWLQFDLTAASGPMISRASDIERSRQDTDILLSLATGLGLRVITAHDLQSHLALRQLAKITSQAPELHSRQALALLTSDRDWGTKYVRTVLSFLEHQQDVVMTAQALFVHPNTIRYRLSRIAEKFDVNLERADDTLLLWLSLRLHAFE